MKYMSNIWFHEIADKWVLLRHCKYTEIKIWKILFWNRRTLVHNRLMYDFFPEFPPIVFFPLPHIQVQKKIEIIMVCVILYFFEPMPIWFFFVSLIYSRYGLKNIQNEIKKNSILSQKKKELNSLHCNVNECKKTGSFLNYKA